MRVVKDARTTMQLDTLQNLLSGMGGVGDKSLYTTYGFNSIDRGQLEAAYRTDWIARKIIDIPAYDASREGRSWQAETKDITLLEQAEKALNLKRKLMGALQKSRLYGGGALIMGVDQGKASDELKVETLGKDCLKWVHVVNRYEITAGPIEYDVASPYYGEPQYYDRTVSAQTANVKGIRDQLRLHPSRVVRFIGAEIPDLNVSQGWGDSILQIVGDAIKRASSVSQGIASMVHEAKIDVIHIPDLTANTGTEGYEAKLKARFGLASDAKSIYNMLLLDKEEEWERITQNFTSLTDIGQMFMLLACGAADIPVTRFLGEAPKGLNATGVSDIRNYYDKVAAEQDMEITPRLNRLDEVLIRSVLGTRPEELFYEWNSLWQMDDTQKAEIANKKATTFKLDVDTGVIDSQVLQKARVAQLIEDGTYPGFEAIVEEFQQQMDDLVDPALQPPDPVIDPATGLPVPPEVDPETGKPVDPNAVDPNADPKAKPAPGKKPAPFGKKAAAPAFGKKKAANDRIRNAKVKDKSYVHDARPRTLYVRRDVLNYKEIANHFKQQGFVTTTGESMHVTLAFSRLPVDWMKAGESGCWGGYDDKGQLALPPGGVRIVEKLGNATCLLFVSSALQWRWCEIKERTGADWSHPEYQPHITISWEGPEDLSNVQPYTGPIVLGPEIFEELNEDWKEMVVEDAKAGRTFGQSIAVAQTVDVRKEVDDYIRTAMHDAGLTMDRAPPVIHVPVKIVMPRKGKEVTKVTKHDAAGRIVEFERREEEDDE